MYPLGVFILLLLTPVFWSLQYSPPIVIIYIILSYFYRIRIYSEQKRKLDLMKNELKTDADLRVEFIREMRSYGIQNVTEEMIQDYIQSSKKD